MNCSNVELNVVAWNLENAFFQVSENLCREKNCEWLYKFPRGCTHKLPDHEMELKKQENWDRRTEKFANFFHDIGLVQEVDDYILQKLSKKINQICQHTLQIKYVPHKQKTGHFASILYDSNKLDFKKEILIEKYCHALEFSIKNTNRIIKIASVHLTGYDIDKNLGAEAGNQQIEKIIQILDNANDLLLIGGDFNAIRNSYRYNIMKKNGFEHYSINEDNSRYTNINPYTKQAREIDFIWIKNAKFIEMKKNIASNQIMEGQDRLSDHSGVFCSILSTEVESKLILESSEIEVHKTKPFAFNDNRTYTFFNFNKGINGFSECIQSPIVFLSNLDADLLKMAAQNQGKTICQLPNDYLENQLEIHENIFYLIEPLGAKGKKIKNSILLNPLFFDRLKRIEGSFDGLVAIDLFHRSSHKLMRLAFVNVSPKFEIDKFIEIFKKGEIEHFFVAGFFSKKKHPQTTKIFQEHGFKFESTNGSILSNIEFCG